MILQLISHATIKPLKSYSTFTKHTMQIIYVSDTSDLLFQVREAKRFYKYWGANIDFYFISGHAQDVHGIMWDYLML